MAFRSGALAPLPLVVGCVLSDHVALPILQLGCAFGNVPVVHVCGVGKDYAVFRYSEGGAE